MGRTVHIILNRPISEILVPDWLITSHVTTITSSDWMFTFFPGNNGVLKMQIESLQGTITALKQQVADNNRYKERHETLTGRSNEPIN